MRIRGLLIAVLALGALSGLVYWSNRAQKAKEGKPASDAPPNILTIAEDQLQQLEIHKTGSEPTILRKDSEGNWQITSPKSLSADQDSVRSIVSTVTSLNSNRLIEEKAADLRTYGLESPALQLIAGKKDGKTAKLLIGDETPTGNGYFAMLDGDPRVYTIASWNKSSIDKTPNDLRDKRLLTFDENKLTRVELALKNQAVEFGKNNLNEWQILKPKPLRADGGQVEQLISRLRDARMDTGLSEEETKKAASAFSGAAPVAVAKATDAAGTQQLEVRKSKDNNYYARSSVVEGIHKITSYVGEGLDKSLEDFRNKKLFDFGWNDPTKIEIRAGDKTTIYEKSSEKWLSAGKQMDSASVQALIDKLRDLSASKFVEQGFATAFFQATVTSGEGKRVEKALVSRTGDKCYARRENEPAIYELEAKDVEELEQAAKDVKEHQAPKEEKKK